MQLTINKWGNSSAIRLPKQVLEQLKLAIDDKLTYTISGNKIVLEKANPIQDEQLTVAELFKGYDGIPVQETPVLFETVGGELW